MKNPLISVSILSSDFCNIGKTLEELKTAGADYIHLDVMDGVFVPNISFGQKMCEDIAKTTALPLDIHLMIEKPSRFIAEFAAAKPKILTVHFEASADIAADLKLIRSLGIKAGVSIKPDTPSDVLTPYLDYIDLVLIMSVHPGFGGQKFMPAALEKVQKLKKAIGDRKILLEIDGGVNGQNAALCVDAGCDILVSGSFVTGAKDMKKAVNTLKN